ncbi:MAG: LytTR family DNA-binding domain-containing protein [Anaerovoracaceae bacterium]
MKIAIIEDLITDAESLIKQIERIGAELNTEMKITCYNEGKGFCAEYYKGEFDLVFMDICLGGSINGMDLAKEIRKVDDQVSIVFTTSEVDYAIEGFRVHALDYLVKPISYDHVSEAICRILGNGKSEEDLIITIGKKDQKIYLSRIMWVSTYNHTLTFHMDGLEDITVYMRFREFLEQIDQVKTLVSCTRGVIVNLEYIDYIDRQSFVLKDGTTVPISRSKFGEMKKLFNDFIIELARRI